MEIELNNEQTTPSQQQEQRKASHDLAAARLVKRGNLTHILSCQKIWESSLNKLKG